jgi:hypothetical protein
MDKFVSTSKASELSLKKNLFKFIQIYGKENLFHKFKGRHFKDFENFMNVEKPNELQKRLTKYSIQLDKEKCVCGKGSVYYKNRYVALSLSLKLSVKGEMGLNKTI